MNKYLIESLIQLIEENRLKGEATLDIPIRVYNLLHSMDADLVEEYEEAYSDFYNKDIKEVPQDLHDRVIDCLRNFQKRVALST